eukprot:Gb_20771 [translate_table: standard]
MEEKRQTVVVVAVDESEESMRALSWACKYLMPSQCPLHEDNTKDQPYKLILIHVQPDTCYAAGPAYILSSEVVNLLEIDASRTTKRVFSRALDVCRKNNVKAETEVLVGEVKERLCQAVKKHGADFLVMGTHGHGFFKRVFMGSVSDYCSQNATCPVLLVNKKVCNSDW